jgi:hypothetical protein
MKRIATTVLLCVLTGLLIAGQKPNFGGKWALDKDRSFSNPAGLDQTLSITQTGDEIKLDAKIKTARGEQNVTETYTLDDKEADFTPQNPPGAKGKRKASWMSNGRGIIIVDQTLVEGKPPALVTRKWSLAPDGKSLTIDYFIDDQRGSFESKRVFNRVE